MHTKYDLIISQIKEARAKEDTAALRRAQKKLEKWQLEYGAYAPVR